MTPAPVTVPDVDPGRLVAAELVGLGTILLMVLVLVALMTWAILRASRRSPPAALIAVLGFIALVSILAYTEARESELITLAATATGALAGALSALFQEAGLPRSPQDGPGAPEPAEPDTEPTTDRNGQERPRSEPTQED